MEATLLLCAVLVSAAPHDSGLASSANFIVHAPDQSTAEGVLRSAEYFRRSLAIDWLGEPLPQGAGPVIVHVRISEQEDLGAMLPLDPPQRTHHIVWLQTSSRMAQGATLAHELLHCVLATKFGKDLPVFAQEGCAGVHDDGEVLVVRRRKLGQMATTQNWPSLRTVLDARHFAATDVTHYTVACSLAEFLFSRGARATFLQFASDGAASNWDSAVRRHYGFNSLSDLESEWRRWAASQVRLAQFDTVRRR